MIRVFNHYLSRAVLFQALLDACVLLLALAIGYQLRLGSAVESFSVLEAASFTGFTLIAMSAAGLYEKHAPVFRHLVLRLIVAALTSFCLLSVFFYVFQDVYVGRGVLLYAITLSLVMLFLVRLGSLPLGRYGILERKVLLLGSASDIERLRRLVAHDERFSGICIKATLEVMPDAEAIARGLPRGADALVDVVREHEIEEIVVSVRDRRGGVLPLRELLDFKLSGVQVIDGEAFCERQVGLVPLENLRASWLLAGDGFAVGMYRDSVKRTFDVVVSGLLMLIAVPVLALAAALIKLDSAGPVIYSQQRVGRHRRPFTIYKLRSMGCDSEADGRAQWTQVDDARITRIGRVLRNSRIDELPQLINVLKGEMSFVGPRPERPEFVSELSRTIPFYDVRHSVKPGITGWSQVRYPYGASIDDARAKLCYDLYYVKNHSLFLDLVILLDTLRVVIFSKGAR
jgi:sugar transferase (PEP-CTERM system associated)